MTRPLLLVLSALFLCSCRQESTHRDWAAMDCNFAATLHGSGAIPPEAALDSLQALSREYEALFTDYDPAGPLSILRGRAGDTVRPDPRIVEVVRGALATMAASRGTLDIGLHDLKALWRIGAENPAVPDSSAIASVLAARFGTDSVHRGDPPLEILPDGRVVLRTDNLPIDLGGVAKGWAVDRMSAALVGMGYPVHLIQAGGEILSRGSKAKGPWKIGIKNPRATRTTAALVVLDSGLAITTSGDYERFFLQGGTRYHHLFDPATGWPARGGVASTTLLCRTSAQCDLWSKPMFLLGPGKGRALADSLGIPVLWILETPSGICGAATPSWGRRLDRDTLATCPS